MARFQCHECGFDGHAEWHGELVCPRCGCDHGVRAAIGIEEMTEAEADAIEALATELEGSEEWAMDEDGAANRRG
ncbi:hypothetical protein L0F51_19725 [Afifella sp. H1R]|uniref:Uncharacterized protein n=1 Tax=Consotaella salsifontis TaxID=1365950 RepID=A0A1T4TCQ0_9HYPH|nr:MULTISPECIES: hypothetical protein [Hyphomicrobiales]MCF1505994.1 hypothetical protein [Afifella sp. H1R]SKA38320.1 hypothetical protein SAMN05428963_1254 [Consotaella salsifontis]